MSSFKDASEHPAFGKTLRVFEVPPSYIDELYAVNSIDVPEDIEVYPNQPLVIKSGQQQSALAMVGKEAEEIRLADDSITYFNIGGRNKEQSLLMEMLRDPEIRCLVVTGPAGTGKTTCIGAYALDQVLDKNNFEKMILSKPLEIVTKSRYWGTVPGDEDEKFSPFLKSYKIMFANMLGTNGRQYIESAMDKREIEFMPLELMRGASLRECICWYDEAQNLNHFETLTLGSRLDDVGNSKLILSGDMAQRDKNIDRQRTGVYKLVTSDEFLHSKHTAHINLIQNERGAISQLFHDVFDDESRD